MISATIFLWSVTLILFLVLGRVLKTKEGDPEPIAFCFILSAIFSIFITVITFITKLP